MPRNALSYCDARGYVLLHNSLFLIEYKPGTLTESLHIPVSSWAVIVLMQYTPVIGYIQDTLVIAYILCTPVSDTKWDVCVLSYHSPCNKSCRAGEQHCMDIGNAWSYFVWNIYNITTNRRNMHYTDRKEKIYSWTSSNIPYKDKYWKMFLWLFRHLTPKLSNFDLYFLKKGKLCQELP